MSVLSSTNEKQEEGEAVDDLITDLYCLAEHCQYGALHDEMIRDRIVVRIRDRRLSEKLQMESELTLDKAVAQVRQSELVKKQQGSLRSEALKEVETVSSKSRASVSKGQSQRPYKGKSRMPGDNRSNKCTRCGRTPAHSRQQCPARMLQMSQQGSLS